MIENSILEAAMGALGTAYGKRAGELSLDQIKRWFSTASSSVDASVDIDMSNIDRLAKDVLKNGSAGLDAEITRKNLARWFEVPSEEFASTKPEQLEPEVMIRHLYLERMVEAWFHDWGYEVSVGEDFEGREGIEFTPDVYGRLQTLHGDFEIFVNFVCDDPPSQYRVRALLETLEAYATDKSDFKWGDIYILATPFQFGRGTTASIMLQSREEKYTVIKLEGDDLYSLQHARDARSRLKNLMEEVEKYRILSPER